VSEATRPAFYALAPGGWRDYVTLLHPPYTLWHLSYVAIGAAIAPHFRASILGLALLAFFLGMGVAAHAFDELHGRPLGTRIPGVTLAVLGTAALAAAATIGVVMAFRTSLWLLAFVAAGAFIAVAYNLELFGGRFHGEPWFALAWGAFPVLATYFAAAETVRLEAVAACAFTALLSAAQRALSTPVRRMRRSAHQISDVGHDAERALRLLTAATAALAIALVLMRVT
jgi:hypothetical protein